MNKTQILKILEEDRALFKSLSDFESKSNYFKEMFIEILKLNLEIKNNEAINVLLMNIYNILQREFNVLKEPCLQLI